MSAPALTPEQEHAVHLVLSRALGKRKGRTQTYPLVRLIAAAWETERTSWRGTETALHRSYSHAELDELWALANVSDLLLPRAVVEAFVPQEAWPAFWQFIASGPAAAYRATDKVLQHWAIGRNLDGTQRGKLTESPVQGMINARHRLALLIGETQEAAAAPELGISLPYEFEAWSTTSLPSRKAAAEFNAQPANRDKAPPPLIVIRRALRQCDRICQANQRRGKPSIEWLRRRAALGILVLGPRSQTVAALREGHVIDRYAFGDDSYGPALLYTVLKGQPGVQRYQGIPDLLLTWIREYTDFMGITGVPEAPLFRTARTTDRPDQTPRGGSISQMCAIALRDFRLPGDEETYTAHTLRRLAEEFASISGTLWVLDHTDDLVYETTGKPMDGQVWADFLLDHEPGKGGVSAVYKSLKNTRVHEKWARMAALGVWEWVWDTRGARQAPDPAAIAAAESRLAAALM